MNYKELLKSKKAVSLILAIGFIGIFLIVLSDMDIKPQEKTAESIEETYRVSLEKDIKDLVKNITGDRDIDVVVTLDTGYEYIYATEESTDAIKEEKERETERENETSDKREEKYIIIKKSSGEDPLLVSSLLPKIRGVSVVCDSGNNEETRENLIDALKVLLGINDKRISISGRINY